jgi:hypothetical protein
MGRAGEDGGGGSRRGRRRGLLSGAGWEIGAVRFPDRTDESETGGLRWLGFFLSSAARKKRNAAWLVCLAVQDGIWMNARLEIIPAFLLAKLITLIIISR